MSLGTNVGWPYEPDRQGTSLNPNRRPIVPVSTPSTEPATPPATDTRVVWRCPEPDCDWRLNTASRQPSEADWRALGKAGPAHYADRHQLAPLPWELRAARDYRGVDPPPDQLGAPVVLAAVRADLAALGDLTGGARGSLAALALYLAEVIDTRGADAPPAASARLAQELRATLQSLMTTEHDSDPDRLGQFLDEMGTPADLPAEVGDAADPGPADARPEGRRHRKGAR